MQNGENRRIMALRYNLTALTHMNENSPHTLADLAAAAQEGKYFFEFENLPTGIKDEEVWDIFGEYDDIQLIPLGAEDSYFAGLLGEDQAVWTDDDKLLFTIVKNKRQQEGILVIRFEPDGVKLLKGMV